MLNAVLTALLLVTPTQNTTSSTPERSGYWGLGLGLELPNTGLATGVAQKSRVGWGYQLGGAIDWEMTPALLVRGSYSYFSTSRGRASLTYVAQGERTSVKQRADWLGAEFDLGVAYQFLTYAPWIPYVGLDLGILGFRGYDYHFNDETRALESVDAGCLVNSNSSACNQNQHDGLELRWLSSASVRGGVRFNLTKWLASYGELSASYLRLGDERISNTLVARDARAKADHLVLFRALVGLRLGL